MLRGRQMLEKALELDVKFAHARAWYGFTDWLLVSSGYSNDTTWLYKAEEELRQALIAGVDVKHCWMIPTRPALMPRWQRSTCGTDVKSCSRRRPEEPSN